VIRGHRLHHFLLNPQIPLKFATLEDHNAGRISEAYLNWELQDQLLLSWLQATISSPVLKKLIGCSSSWQLWNKVHNYFHAHMTAKARQLRTELRQQTLEGESVSDFLFQFKLLLGHLPQL